MPGKCYFGCIKTTFYVHNPVFPAVFGLLNLARFKITTLFSSINDATDLEIVINRNFFVTAYEIT